MNKSNIRSNTKQVGSKLKTSSSGNVATNKAVGASTSLSNGDSFKQKIQAKYTPLNLSSTTSMVSPPKVENLSNNISNVPDSPKIVTTQNVDNIFSESNNQENNLKTNSIPSAHENLFSEIIAAFATNLRTQISAQVTAANAQANSEMASGKTLLASQSVLDSALNTFANDISVDNLELQNNYDKFKKDMGILSIVSASVEIAAGGLSLGGNLKSLNARSGHEKLNELQLKEDDLNNHMQKLLGNDDTFDKFYRREKNYIKQEYENAMSKGRSKQRSDVLEKLYQDLQDSKNKKIHEINERNLENRDARREELKTFNKLFDKLTDKYTSYHKSLESNLKALKKDNLNDDGISDNDIALARSKSDSSQNITGVFDSIAMTLRGLEGSANNYFGGTINNELNLKNTKIGNETQVQSSINSVLQTTAQGLVTDAQNLNSGGSSMEQQEGTDANNSVQEINDFFQFLERSVP